RPVDDGPARADYIGRSTKGDRDAGEEDLEVPTRCSGRSKRCIRFPVVKGWRLGAILLACLAYAQTAPDLEPILTDIKQTWAVLTRSNRTLATSAADPKFRPDASGRWPVYFTRDENLQRIRQQLRREMPAADLYKIDLRVLPEKVDVLPAPGLLYLPRP